VTSQNINLSARDILYMRVSMYEVLCRTFLLRVHCLLIYRPAPEGSYRSSLGDLDFATAVSILHLLILSCKEFLTLSVFLILKGRRDEFRPKI
jgi:hypothetical protein